MTEAGVARLPWARAAVILLAVVVTGSALAACSSPAAEEPGLTLPDYAYRSAAALRGYQIAVRNQELLAQLPCYCGCGQDPQFENLRDCFISEEGEFSSHAANCQVCIEEAADAERWLSQGSSTAEVRRRIDEKYEGRGQPTDTPPVVEEGRG